MQNLAQNKIELHSKPKSISIAKTYFKDKFGNVVSPNSAQYHVQNKMTGTILG